MTLPKIPNFNPYVWVAVIVGALLLIWALIWLLGSPAREAATAAKHRAGEIMGEAQAEAGKDATKINDEAQKGAAQNEELTRENEAAIRAACPGPDCNSTALRGLCRRPSYRCSDDCVRLLGRADPACPR